ncbi:MAG: hypothetical protein IH623_27630 [Verrucomicrobia bacterium]|nr:hypothetical protein [Verrucomicrobiota bacterium]
MKINVNAEQFAEFKKPFHKGTNCFLVGRFDPCTETTVPKFSVLTLSFMIPEGRWLNVEATRRMNASWYRPADTLGRGLAVAYGVFTPHHDRQALIRCMQNDYASLR